MDKSAVRKLERRLFPEFEESPLLLHADPERTYTYFAPSQYVGILLTDSWLKKLQAGKTVLSVGAGAAYLERFLIEYGGVSGEQFVLADIASVMPDGFSTVHFDMCEPWPIEQKFDYVIFPNSAGRVCRDLAACSREGPSCRGSFSSVAFYVHLFSEAWKVLENRGQVRMQGAAGCYDENFEEVTYELGEEFPDSRFFAPRSGLVVFDK